MADFKSIGVEKIAAERERQVREEGWTPEHDDEHGWGQMALVAALFATPVKLYEQAHFANEVVYRDPWPWEQCWDKRFRCGERRVNPGNVVPDPATYGDEEAVDLLAKAGALIAAEIDRRERRRAEAREKRG